MWSKINDADKISRVGNTDWTSVLTWLKWIELCKCKAFFLTYKHSTCTGTTITVERTPTSVNVSHAQIHIKLRLRDIFPKLRHLGVVFTKVFFSSFLLCASVHEKICNLHFQSKTWWWKFLSWCHHACLVFLQMTCAISLGWFTDLERGLIIIIHYSLSRKLT